jgi:hypothetical protein
MLVVAAALVVLGGAWLALHQAEVLVGRALTIVLGSGVGTHRSLTLDRDGQIVVENLVFRADGEPDFVRVERMLMETPGWRWFLRNALDPELRDARLDRLRLSLNGVRVDNDGALPLKDLGAFGVASASPWDADGCPQQVRWTTQTLAEAGLAPGSPSLRFDYRAQAGDLIATATLETYGVSRLQWVRIGTLPSNEANMLRLAAEPGLTRSEHWEVQDQGFVAARNRYCASRQEIDERRFVDRHVESVERRLTMLGLDVDADTRDRYRRFALAGGRLSLSVAPPRPLSASALLQLHQSAAWSETVTTLDRNGDIGALHWHRIASTPSPGTAPEVSTDTALQQAHVDGFELIPSTSEPPTTDAEIAAGPPPTTGMPVETPVETPLQAPAETPVDTQVEAPAASAATQAAPEDAAPVSEPAPRTASAIPATPLAMPPLARFVTPAPESATRAAILSTARVMPTRPAATAPKPLSWNELRTARGRTIEIWTIHSPPRRVQILEFSDDALRVSFRIKNSGEATFSIKREAFLRAMLKS